MKRSKRRSRGSTTGSLLEGFMIEGVSSDEKIVVGSEWVSDRDPDSDEDDYTRVKVTHVEMAYLPTRKTFMPLVAYEWTRGSKRGREYQSGVDDIAEIFAPLRRVK
jgi:hypothetical protein